MVILMYRMYASDGFGGTNKKEIKMAQTHKYMEKRIIVGSMVEAKIWQGYYKDSTLETVMIREIESRCADPDCVKLSNQYPDGVICAHEKETFYFAETSKSNGDPEELMALTFKKKYTEFDWSCYPLVEGLITKVIW